MKSEKKKEKSINNKKEFNNLYIEQDWIIISNIMDVQLDKCKKTIIYFIVLYVFIQSKKQMA